MKVLLLDNFDSFTYNIYHYLEPYCSDIEIVRNDELTVEEAASFTHLVISPGPGLPEEAGITLPLLKKYCRQKPILGICLGAQALAQFFGGKLYNQNEVAHGISRTVLRQGPSHLLDSLPDQFRAGLYHSWAIRATPALKEAFKITALRQDTSTVMALEHRSLPLAGVQFHPESIMSEGGHKLIENFLNYQPVSE